MRRDTHRRPFIAAVAATTALRDVAVSAAAGGSGGSGEEARCVELLPQVKQNAATPPLVQALDRYQWTESSTATRLSRGCSLDRQKWEGRCLSGLF